MKLWNGKHILAISGPTLARHVNSGMLNGAGRGFCRRELFLLRGIWTGPCSVRLPAVAGEHKPFRPDVRARGQVRLCGAYPGD